MEYRLNFFRILRACLLIHIVLLGVIFNSWGQTIEDDLKLYGQDVRLEESPNLQGFFLYVRKKPGIASVLLTESSETVSKDENTYAFRAPNYNGVNGNEKRVLNGRFIQAKDGFFIVDSTPEPDAKFGSAFVLFVPYILEYGYENTRNGVLDIQDEGFYMSVRTFTSAYADYTGSYLDNSFYLERVEEVADNLGEDIPRAAFQVPPNADPEIQPIVNLPPQGQVPQTGLPPVQAIPQPVQAIPQPVEPQATNVDDALDSFMTVAVSDKYSPDTVASFSGIAKRAGTKPVYVENKNDIVDKIANILTQLPTGKSSDVVILLDTTRSMWDDLAVLKSRLIPTIGEIMQGEIYRIGIVLYRDEGEEYITKKLEFNEQLEIVQKNINAVQARGGGDWPESVYDALDVGINDYSWIAENRVIFIVGDAPPHEPPNTTIDLNELYSTAVTKKIIIYPLIVPSRD